MATAARASTNPAEPEALRLAFAYLVNSIDTSSLLSDALSRGLIREQQRAACASEPDPYKQAEKFLGHLQREVNGDSNKFKIFVQLLVDTGQSSLASRLRNELSNANKSMQLASVNSNEEQMIVVPDELVDELASLRIGYASLLRNYKRVLENSPESQEEFVRTLPGLLHHTELSLDFQKCFDMLINEEVSLFNISYLKHLCNIFQRKICKATKKLVVKYDKQRKDFMASTTVNQFKELFPASATPSKLSTGKIILQLKLCNQWGYSTLSDLNNLVIQFGDPGNYLHLSKAYDGCIAVVWLTSSTNAEVLKAAISDGAGILQSKGVLQVFIEEELVLDCSQGAHSESAERDHKRAPPNQNVSIGQMGDRSRPLVHDVCAACFHADPQNSSLCYLPHHCRSPGMHRNTRTVPVTYHNGSMVQYHNGAYVREPPPDRVMETVPRQFTVCRNGPECRHGTRCYFPHNEEERRQWNIALHRFRSRGQQIAPPQGMVPVFPPQPMHFPLHYPPLIPLVSPQPFQPPILPAAHIPPQFLPPVPRQEQWPLTPQLQQQRSADSRRAPPTAGPRHAPPTAGRHHGQQRPSEADLIRDAAIPLTRESYEKKFTALLYLEEDVHDKLLKEKCNGVYQFNVKPRERAPRSLQRRMVEHVRFASIYGMTGDQMMYAAQASECVFICDPSNERRVARADIILGGSTNILGNKLSLGFRATEASKLERYFGIIQDDSIQLEVDANFEVKHSYFQMLRRSLENLSDDAIERIMPKGGDFVDGLNLTRVPFPKEYESLNLDKKQFRALQLILFSRSRAPVIIPGPFGTGKTRILAVATHNFIETAKVKDGIARVLVCCHHQVSADTFVESYFGDMSTDRHSPWEAELIRLTRKSYYSRDVNYDNLYMPIDEFSEQVGAGRCTTAKYLVVVTTFSTALNLVSLLGDQFFTHILLDEGAQVREPEAVAPLCMANKDTKIVIAGDPQQVGPAILVLGDRPQQHGLGVSLLERLLKAYKEAGGNNADYIAHLTTNHRCHENILELPSRLFYGSSLVPMSLVRTVPDAPYPLLFLCSSIADPLPTEEDTSNKEAKLLVEQFRQFCRKGDTRSFQLGTCFMALSRRQVTVIKNYLSRQETALVKLIPSYEIQGREFKALFISTMECVQDGFQSANPTKSFCNRYVFNTALTRAQSLVVCAGNPFQLLKVEAAMADHVGCWREYLRRCIENGTFIVPDRVGNSNSVIARLRQLIDTAGGLPTAVAAPCSGQLPQVDPIEIEHQKILKKLEKTVKQPTVSTEGTEVTSSPGTMGKKSKKKNRKKNKRKNQPPERLPLALPPAVEPARVPAHSPAAPVPAAPPPTTPIARAPPPTTPIARAPPPTTPIARAPPPTTPIARAPLPTTPIARAPLPPASQRPSAQPSQRPSAQPSQRPSTQPSRHLPQVQRLPDRHQLRPSGQSRPAGDRRSTAGSRQQPQESLFYNEDFPTPGEASRQPSRRGRPLQAAAAPPSPQDIGDILHRFKHDHQPRDEDLLKADLTVDNYKRKFHQLLCREEDEHERILIDKCNGMEYTLTMYHHRAESPANEPGDYYRKPDEDRYGYVHADHLDGDKITYIEQACENNGNMIITCNGRSYRATMVTPHRYKRWQGVIFVGMSMPDAYQLKCLTCQFSIQVKVDFELKYSYFDHLHKAVNLLSCSTLQRLFPSSANCFSAPQTNPELFLSKKYQEFLTLDFGQLRALDKIVYAEPKAPVIVAGSFGTGKTQMLAQAAFQIFIAKRDENMRPRVLVCAHHQASANSFLTNYFVPMKEKNEWKASFVRMMPRNRIEQMKERYKPYCRTAFQVAKRLDKIGLVVSTFGTTLQLAEELERNGTLGTDWFTHILIDEGAQTREPETITPLSLCGENTAIAIAGDHKQVGPAMLVLGKDPLKYGLGQSLLERLHTLYYAQSSANAENHCATLLTNYRCHRSLLALPSYLFYHSALITNKMAVKQALLHPDTTFSLHFICSSLDDSIVEVTENTNRREANLLLQAAADYVEEWPPEWKEKKLSTVCLMATTANQRDLMRKALNPSKTSKPNNFRKCLVDSKLGTSVEVRKAYDMQGLEFQCVFLSTAEPTTDKGESKNPTKTPCSQYVFNTALTRAKSLVVCAGNPFLLMRIEQKVGNKDGPCWAHYIRRCIENETLVVPPDLWSDEKERQEKINKLTELVFKSDSHRHADSSQVTMDSITKAYKKAFESQPGLQDCQLQLKSALEGLQWEMEDKTSSSPAKARQEVSVDGKLLCNLEIMGYNKALGHPLDSTESVILNGLKNWKGALDGDLVAVEVFDTAKDVEKRYGKVVGVVEKCHQERYLCRMDRHSTIHFNPTDRKTPRIVNLPKISRNLMNLRKKDIEDGLTAQHQWVVIFEEDSLPRGDRDELPRIKEIITAESARNLLFVVRVIGWEPDHRLPLGAVVESLPLGTNSFHAERLLRAAYSIYKDDLDQESSDEESQEEESDPTPQALAMPQGDVVCQAFTIDPSDACNLDDALSLVRESNNTYTMAVLIPNVGSQLEQGSDLDKRAQERATSVYGFFRNMIPAEVCRKISLSPNGVRKAFIVFTKVTLDKDGTVSIDTADTDIREGKMQSQVRLNYLEAQHLFSERSSDSLQEKIDQYPSLPGQPDLVQSLQHLYKIAMYLRVQRLGKAAYAYSLSEEESIESWQAHLLVEELMIWANSTVAAYIYRRMASYAVLRRQPGPDEHELKELQSLHGQAIRQSVGMSSQGIGDSLAPMVIPRSTLLVIQNAIVSNDAVNLQRLLTSDSHYPQLAAAAGRMITISQRAEYVCGYSFSNQQAASNSSLFRHHSLCLDYYTHFTSPIRRYCDVVVQRLLLSILNHSESSYTAQELDALCRHFNIRSRGAKQFESAVKQLKFAKQFGESCEETRAYVCRNKNTFEVIFPELKYKSCLKREKAEFHLSMLVCEKDRDDNELLKWTVFMFSFSGNDFILNNSQLKELPSDGSPLGTKTTMTVFYIPEDENPLKLTDPLSNKNPHLSREIKGRDRLFKLQLCAAQTQEVVDVDPEKWQSVIQKVDNLTDDTMQELSAALPEAQPQEQDRLTCNATTVEQFRQSPIVKYEVACKLGSNSIVPVWLGQTLVKETFLSPCLQLMEVAPELRICLHHNRYPAECFSDPQFSQASKERYKSLKEYISLWESVFLAEVAQDSVLSNDKHINILKDVHLQWPELKIPENSTGEYYLPKPNSQITLTIPPESRHFQHYNMNIGAGDLVCVRYDIKEDQCKAVYHLVVKKVHVDKGNKMEDEDENEDEKYPLVVSMEYKAKRSCQVSPRIADILRRKQPSCELQVINLKVSYSRVYKVLVSLDEHEARHSHDGQCRLVSLVARGDIEAIKNYKRNSLEKEFLKVLKTDNKAHSLWTRDIKLNPVQLRAIELALTNSFQLIQGPPGTGKSETGAHIAYIFAKVLKDHYSNQCVVYCAPSNKAVDVVHEKLLEANEKSHKSKKLKLLRLYGKVHEKMDFPGPYTAHGYLQSYEGEVRCREKFRQHALHYIIREDRNELTDLEERFKEMEHEGTVPAPAMIVKHKNLIKSKEQAVIGGKYDIILATCNECAGTRLSRLKKIGRIAQVIVDECGMAHEPETIAAVSLSNHVVLIGDHKQLQPVIKYTAARENGMSTSLFQRYADNFEDDCPLVTLEIQYRMHEKICKFPSDHFYEGVLEADDTVKRRRIVEELRDFWPAGARCPVVFCDVVKDEREFLSASEKAKTTVKKGLERRRGRKTDPHSKCNPGEAEKAVEIALALRSRIRDRSITIGVITPYRAQKDRVVDLIPENVNVSVHTINECQGDEYDYVILTTVRSLPLNEIRDHRLVQADRQWLRDNLGFLTDEHQINVAITRARQGLIIVGNCTLLEYDTNTWKPLIEFYSENRCIVEGSKFPRCVKK